MRRDRRFSSDSIRPGKTWITQSDAVTRRRRPVSQGSKPGQIATVETNPQDQVVHRLRELRAERCAFEAAADGAQQIVREEFAHGLVRHLTRRGEARP